MVRRVLSGEGRLLLGGIDAILTSSFGGTGGLPCSCVDAYTSCPSHGAFSWVPVDREAPDGQLCSLAGVYMINCEAGEGARGGESR
jgi:hypothetical protein